MDRIHFQYNADREIWNLSQNRMALGTLEDHLRVLG